jgi:hypothetical protein
VNEPADYEAEWSGPGWLANTAGAALLPSWLTLPAGLVLMVLGHRGLGTALLLQPVATRLLLGYGVRLADRMGVQA